MHFLIAKEQTAIYNNIRKSSYILLDKNTFI